MDPIVGSIITQGGNIAGSLINWAAQNDAIKKQNAFNEEQQRKMNAYNSPQAMQSRLISAGLSPAAAAQAILGNAGASQQTAPVVQSSLPGNPLPDNVGDATLAGANALANLKGQEIDNKYADEGHQLNLSLGRQALQKAVLDVEAQELKNNFDKLANPVLLQKLSHDERMAYWQGLYTQAMVMSSGMVDADGSVNAENIQKFKDFALQNLEKEAAQAGLDLKTIRAHLEHFEEEFNYLLEDEKWSAKLKAVNYDIRLLEYQDQKAIRDQVPLVAKVAKYYGDVGALAFLFMDPNGEFNFDKLNGLLKSIHSDNGPLGGLAESYEDWRDAHDARQLTKEAERKAKKDWKSARNAYAAKMRGKGVDPSGYNEAMRRWDEQHPWQSFLPRNGSHSRF